MSVFLSDVIEINYVSFNCGSRETAVLKLVLFFIRGASSHETDNQLPAALQVFPPRCDFKYHFHESIESRSLFTNCKGLELDTRYLSVVGM